VSAGHPIPIHQALAGQRAGAAASQPQRSALALGLVGGLGEELLASLMSAPEYRAVFVGVTSMIGSASPKFRPWLVGRGTPVVDDAFVGVTGEETFVPSASPIRRFGEADVLEAARAARDAGATTLVLVTPLPALLQMGEATRTLASVDDVALVEMGFDRLLIVRPTAADDLRRAPNAFVSVVRAAGRALADLMLPSYARALSARTAAQAIVEAVRQAKPGVSVLGAKELAAIVEAKMPKLLARRPKLR
jgi:hypothetical protein